MLIQVKELLSAETVKHCRDLLQNSTWKDGKHTAGLQSSQVKNNQQLPEEAAELPELRQIIMQNLQRNGLFFSAALPRRVFPPLFNRYSGETNSFGNHVDNAIRTMRTTGESIRTDVSCTVFLCDPSEYEGGELVIEDTFGTNSIKLKAGDAILYPATSLHRVNPVTKGERLASFFWIESMVRSNDHRRILFDMDLAITALRNTSGDSQPVVTLTACYHNLLRLWSET
ncbi:MAG: Fe2+-dependent dioxygenase [Rickettsiaceae bacterium]|jgi:PKHD-type hydroxylase|nr:Fe2+-dependent dioxygenase [Rickettsiaceae bacterium]